MLLDTHVNLHYLVSSICMYLAAAVYSQHDSTPQKTVNWFCSQHDSTEIPCFKVNREGVFFFFMVSTPKILLIPHAASQDRIGAWSRWWMGEWVNFNTRKYCWFYILFLLVPCMKCRWMVNVVFFKWFQHQKILLIPHAASQDRKSHKKPMQQYRLRT